MSKQNNAPDAWQGVEGDNQNTNSQGGEPIVNQNTASPSRDAILAEAVEAAFARIEHSEHGYINLDPGDVLYCTIESSILRPMSWLCVPIEEHVGQEYPVHVLDRHGRVAELPHGYIRAISAQVRIYWRGTPNCAIRLGDLLLISLGPYEPRDLVNVGGEEMIEALTADESMRRSAILEEAKA